MILFVNLFLDNLGCYVDNSARTIQYNGVPSFAFFDSNDTVRFVIFLLVLISYILI